MPPEQKEAPSGGTGGQTDDRMGAGAVVTHDNPAGHNQTIARAAKAVGMTATELRRYCADQGSDPLTEARAILARLGAEPSRVERRADRFRPRAEAIRRTKYGDYYGAPASPYESAQAPRSQR